MRTNPTSSGSLGLPGRKGAGIPGSGLSPAKKLEISSRLNATARKVKLAAMRAKHSDWTEKQLIEQVNRRFFFLHD